MKYYYFSHRTLFTIRAPAYEQSNPASANMLQCVQVFDDEDYDCLYAGARTCEEGPVQPKLSTTEEHQLHMACGLRKAAPELTGTLSYLSPPQHHR